MGLRFFLSAFPSVLCCPAVTPQVASSIISHVPSSPHSPVMWRGSLRGSRGSASSSPEARPPILGQCTCGFLREQPAAGKTILCEKYRGRGEARGLHGGHECLPGLSVLLQQFFTGDGGEGKYKAVLFAKVPKTAVAHSG